MTFTQIVTVSILLVVPLIMWFIGILFFSFFIHTKEDVRNAKKSGIASVCAGMVVIIYNLICFVPTRFLPLVVFLSGVGTFFHAILILHILYPYKAIEWDKKIWKSMVIERKK